MQNMEAITIHAKSKEQVEAFAQLAKAFDLSFEVESKRNNKEYEAMLKKSYQQVKEGKTVKRAVKHLT